MYFSISTDKFAKKEGNFDIITVKDNIIYIQSDLKSFKLDKDFEEVKVLPDDIAELTIVDLEPIKKAKNKELEEERLKASTQSVEYKGNKILATEQDQLLLVKLIAIMGNTDKTAKTQYICEDNTIVEYGLADLMAISTIIQEQSTNAYVKCRLLKDKVNVAKTQDEINSIKWDK